MNSNSRIIRPGERETVIRKEPPPAPARTSDLHRLIDELKSVKARALQFELARLDEQYRHQLETALRGSEQRSKSGSFEEVRQLQQETRRILERELESSKTLLQAKFDKIDQGLVGLLAQANTLSMQQERDAELAAREAKVKQLEEENAKLREELQSQLAAAAAKSKEIDERLARTDVAKRAEELDALKEELEMKLQAYEAEMGNVVRQRDELNKDFDKLGQKRAELDNEAERLRDERKKLDGEKRSIGTAVARDMATAIEAFLVDLMQKRSGGPIDPLDDIPVIRAGPSVRRSPPPQQP